MKGKTMFNYPRKLYSIDKVRRKAYSISTPAYQQLFLEWLNNLLVLYRIHKGDTQAMILGELIQDLDAKWNKIRPGVMWHEKSKAFRIRRNANHGGTPWYPEEFETEAAAIEWILRFDLIRD